MPYTDRSENIKKDQQANCHQNENGCLRNIEGVEDWVTYSQDLTNEALNQDDWNVWRIIPENLSSLFSHPVVISSPVLRKGLLHLCMRKHSVLPHRQLATSPQRNDFGSAIRQQSKQLE